MSIYLSIKTRLNEKLFKINWNHPSALGLVIADPVYRKEPRSRHTDKYPSYTMRRHIAERMSKRFINWQWGSMPVTRKVTEIKSVRRKQLKQNTRVILGY